MLGIIWLLRKGVYGSRISARASSAAGLNCWGWSRCQEECLYLGLTMQGVQEGDTVSQRASPPPFPVPPGPRLTNCTTFSKRGQCVGDHPASSREMELWGYPRYNPSPGKNVERSKHSSPWGSGTWESQGKMELPCGAATGHVHRRVGAGKDIEGTVQTMSRPFRRTWRLYL